jgi:hypothetical protein
MLTELIVVKLPVQFEVRYELIVLCRGIRNIGARPAECRIIIDPLHLLVMSFVQSE